MREAQPGEIVLLYGTGFGPVNPPILAGRLFDTPNQMTAPVRVRFGGTWVDPIGGLASPGLYQIAVQAPDSALDGDLEVVAEVAGKQSPAARIPVQRPEPQGRSQSAVARSRLRRSWSLLSRSTPEHGRWRLVLRYIVSVRPGNSI